MIDRYCIKKQFFFQIRRYFGKIQPLVDHLVSANPILFNKSIIQDLVQKIQTWDWKTMIEIQNV
jgi:hypothetical protein